MVRERDGADASCYGLLIDGKQFELFSLPSSIYILLVILDAQQGWRNIDIASPLRQILDILY